MPKNDLFQALCEGLKNGLFDDVDEVGASEDEKNAAIEHILNEENSPGVLSARTDGKKVSLEIRGNSMTLITLMCTVYDEVFHLMAKHSTAMAEVFNEWILEVIQERGDELCKRK